jgi:head-tail adaptor
MQAGKLRHQINLLSPPALTLAAYGKQPPAQAAFTLFATVWASIEPISSREMDFARSFAGTTSHKVRIRCLANVNKTLQVQYGSRVFSINGILNFEERNIFLDLYCTEMDA